MVMMTFAVAFTRDLRMSRQQAPEASLDVLVLSSNGLIPCPPGNMTSLGETLDFNPFFPGRGHCLIRTSNRVDCHFHVAYNPKYGLLSGDGL
jgi:hypothetical protein